MPFWSPEEEMRLVDLVKEGASLEDIAQTLKRTPEAISMKLRRLGFSVPSESAAKKIENKVTTNTTTTTGKPLEPVQADDLPSSMEALQLLWAAVLRLKDPDISAAEIKKLRLIVSSVKAYAALHSHYLIPMERWERQLLAMQEASLADLKIHREREEDPEEKAQLEASIKELEKSIAEAKAVKGVPEKLKER